MTAGLTICGCGWLGKYLATRAHATMDVIGTTRSEENFPALQALGVTPFLFSLGDNVEALVSAGTSSTVVLNIPPGRKEPVGAVFISQMTKLIDKFVSSGAKHIIFISTTSVYGEDDGMFKEDTPVSPQTASAKAHVAIEQHLSSNSDGRFTILRLAGLVGPDRHPVHSLAGRLLEKGEKAVNLVHVDDAVAAILALKKQGGRGQTLHLCSNQHPKRGDYYSFCAHTKGLAVPQFNAYQEIPVSGKIIDASRSWQQLGLTLRYASPYDMI
ncbi:NAD(P)H-binding protein [Alteromonas pelagimontana]|uniref:NAD(P)H-binding protein n=1 Tax=Alteromonas pelagimontana TaxID=1858656 RepID=A0A6M4MFD9_9ALTE|nr:NAD-dependent epimerase/dehydratase family protein [Alteromonas pelagimontana]QJR81598.1 NAD(P)H-binding protein [Alteromonas pelagimontana]